MARRGHGDRFEPAGGYAGEFGDVPFPLDRAGLDVPLQTGWRELCLLRIALAALQPGRGDAHLRGDGNRRRWQCGPDAGHARLDGQPVRPRHHAARDHDHVRAGVDGGEDTARFEFISVSPGADLLVPARWQRLGRRPLPRRLLGSRGRPPHILGARYRSRGQRRPERGHVELGGARGRRNRARLGSGTPIDPPGHDTARGEAAREAQARARCAGGQLRHRALHGDCLGRSWFSRAARVLKLRPASAQVAEGARARSELRFPKGVSRTVRRALARRQKVRVAIGVTARDLAGNATTARRNFKLTR